MLKTYLTMNEQIKTLLKNGEGHDQYAYARIVELEEENARYKEALKEIAYSAEPDSFAFAEMCEKVAAQALKD